MNRYRAEVTLTMEADSEDEADNIVARHLHGFPGWIMWEVYADGPDGSK